MFPDWTGGNLLSIGSVLWLVLESGGRVVGL